MSIIHRLMDDHRFFMVVHIRKTLHSPLRYGRRGAGGGIAGNPAGTAFKA
ncbi:hypothetical protein Q6Y00_000585 [Salmonella enterica]|nr:hypothetical protein [Salmonella enterica]EHF3218964.1 hypothetical protein [Salmonella enterica subsp. houtenae serovar Houten]HAU2792636.1 hypothetical protein [Salmonella enterica subsp. houtenae]HCM1980014.1 hypothetical protein [Salmonella enterica subsp. houtenae serovar 41:z36:-]EEQ1468268.1 hypothetical protein [Salmonella enterica]